MRFGILWGEAHRLSGLGFGFCEVLALGQGICEIKMGLGETRAQLHRRIKLSNGCINLALVEKYPAKGVVCLRAFWRQPNQFRKILMGAVKLPLLDSSHTLRVERFGMLLLGRCCCRRGLSMKS